MSLEEISESPTYCDGLIDILSWWRLKVPVCPSEQKNSGFVPTLNPEIGTREWMKHPSKPCYEDLK